MLLVQESRLAPAVPAGLYFLPADSGDDVVCLQAIQWRSRSTLCCYPRSKAICELIDFLKRSASNQVMRKARRKRVAGSHCIHNAHRESWMLNRLLLRDEHTSTGPARDADQPQVVLVE